jgi:hypothetical protein
MNPKKMTWEEFVESGLLQEMNRRFLHPLSLEFRFVRQGNRLELDGILDYISENDPEPTLAKIDQAKQQRVADRLIESVKVRQKKLGFVVQGEPAVEMAPQGEKPKAIKKRVKKGKPESPKDGLTVGGVDP